MKTTLLNWWVAIKRNPVINGFLIAVATQVLQDWRAGNIDFAHIFGYLAAVFIAVATRHFTTPAKEMKKLNRETNDLIVKAYGEGVIEGRSQRLG
jgi:hypothetical protein